MQRSLRRQEEIDRLRRMLSEIKPEDPALREQIARLEKMVEDLRQRLKQCQQELDRSNAENQVCMTVHSDRTIQATKATLRNLNERLRAGAQN